MAEHHMAFGGTFTFDIPTYRAVCVEVDGAKELQLTRMEYRHLRRGGGEYFSVDDYQLRDGLRAAVGEQEYGVLGGATKGTQTRLGLRGPSPTALRQINKINTG
jgi:hypothetical protein